MYFPGSAKGETSVACENNAALREQGRLLSLKGGKCPCSLLAFASTLLSSYLCTGSHYCPTF